MGIKSVTIVCEADNSTTTIKGAHLAVWVNKNGSVTVRSEAKSASLTTRFPAHFKPYVAAYV